MPLSACRTCTDDIDPAYRAQVAQAQAQAQHAQAQAQAHAQMQMQAQHAQQDPHVSCDVLHERNPLTDSNSNSTT
jgi:hypothetical protein